MKYLMVFMVLVSLGAHAGIKEQYTCDTRVKVSVANSAADSLLALDIYEEGGADAEFMLLDEDIEPAKACVDKKEFFQEKFKLELKGKDLQYAFTCNQGAQEEFHLIMYDNQVLHLDFFKTLVRKFDNCKKVGEE